MIDVVGHKTVAPIIEDETKAATGVECRCEVSSRRIETEVEIPQRKGWPQFARRRDLSAVAAIDSVQAIIESPTETVHIAVSDSERETFQYDLAHIGFSVAVHIFQEKDFRRRGDEHAAAPRCNGGREAK